MGTGTGGRSGSEEEVVLPFPEHMQPLRRVRSTIVLASLADIRRDGLYAAYGKNISSTDLQKLEDLIAGVWVDTPLAAAHYAACDKLDLPVADQVARGRRAAQTVGGSIFGTAIRAAKEAGATPWTVLPQLPRFWARAYDGGAMSVVKLGPKDARVDLVEMSLLEVPYYRRALQGWLNGMLELFCARLYLREQPWSAGSHAVRYHAQWA